MSKPILFHVGLHKTATSSLQQDFFTPQNGFQQNGGRSWISPVFVSKFSTELVNDAEQARINAFADAAHDAGLFPVASHERLSGYPLSGGYDRLANYNRIRSIRNDAKILFIMREQKAWLYSAWKQATRDKGATSLRRFLTKKSATSTARIPGPHFEYINYQREIETLHTMFGPENVCAVPMEMLTKDFPRFLAMLGDFLDIPAERFKDSALSRKNESMKISELYFIHFVNRFVLRSPTSPNGLLSDGQRLSKLVRSASYRFARDILPETPFASRIAAHHKATIKAAVGDYFNASNRAAGEMLGMDLGQYGYVV